jgi:hypothetical protein
MASPMENSSWPAAIRYQAIGWAGFQRRTPTITATTMPRETTL